MVGGRKSLHCSAIYYIYALELRQPSQKWKSQSGISCLVSCGSFCIQIISNLYNLSIIFIFVGIIKMTSCLLWDLITLYSDLPLPSAYFSPPNSLFLCQVLSWKCGHSNQPIFSIHRHRAVE